MLHLHLSNRFEALAELLMQRLDGPRDNPFEPDTVLVPSAAVQRALTLALARRHGVCAHLQCGFAAQWLWRQATQLLAAAAALTGQAGDDMAMPEAPDSPLWPVYAALGDAAFVAAHPRLAHYLAGADPVMRYELAQRLASLFDQYATYRPDWAVAWAAGQPSGAPAHADEAWQAALWQRLAHATDSAGLQAAASRHAVADATALLAQLPEATGRALLDAAGVPALVQLLALPTLAPLHLALLQQLARWRAVHIHALNPCAEFWFDVVSARQQQRLALAGRGQHLDDGQPLLASWGRQAQVALGQLVDATDDGVLDDAHDQPHPGSHLLARLHNSILQLQAWAPGSQPLADDDRSIELHVCHGRLRELEVLHDRLLGLLAGPNPPALDRILVVTPDLEATAPLVDAVFGTAPPERYLPYTLTGRSVSRSNAPAQALLAALDLAGSRWPVSAVFGLLQQPVVARRFGLDEAGLDRVHGWLRDAGVHWGLDGAHRAGLGLPGQPRHTLADGLARLFLGAALPGEVDEPFAGLLPAGEAEGSAAADLGALWRFVQALRTLQAAVAQPLPPARWPALLVDTLAALVTPADDDQEPLRELHATVQAQGAQWQRSGLAEPLPLAVVQAALTQALDDPPRGGVPSGTITFSAMNSLRGLPFDVVALIGLDDGAWPTVQRPAEFDLIAAAPRRGDRARRDEERNTFLDLLLSARSHLHLSHTGRNARDNSPIPPSVLVDELLDVLVPAITGTPLAGPLVGGPAIAAASAAQARARLVVQHPLQAFALAGFQLAGDPRLRSHDSELALAVRAAAQATLAPAPVTEARGLDLAAGLDEATDDGDGDDSLGSDGPLPPFFTQPLPAPGPEWRQLDLAQLQAFFRNPCRALLRQRLGIALPRPEDELLDDEPFLPDFDARDALAQRLLPPLLAGTGLADLQALAEAGVELPAGAFGQRVLQVELNALQRHAQQVRAASQGEVLPPHAVSLTLDVDGQTWRLNAGFAELRAQGLLRHRSAKLGAHDLLGAWLAHLILCAAPAPGAACVTTVLGRDGLRRFRPCDDPQAELVALLRLVALGWREPLYFFPRSAWAYIENGESDYNARKLWTPSSHNRFAEALDPAYRLALRGLPDPMGAGYGDFVDLARQVFDPLLRHLEPTG